VTVFGIFGGIIALLLLYFTFNQEHKANSNTKICRSAYF